MMRYAGPNDLFVPVAMGQVVEVPLSELDEFNRKINAAVTEAAEKAGVIPPQEPAEEKVG